MRVLIAAVIWFAMCVPACLAQQPQTEPKAETQPATPANELPAAPPALPDGKPPAAPAEKPPAPPPAASTAKQPKATPQPPVEVRVPGRIHVVIDALPKPPEKLKPASSTDPVWYFMEHWSWLFGFVFIAAAAWYSGAKDSAKAVTIEIDAEEARSAQRLIEAGDASGQSKLEAIIVKYPTLPKKKKRQKGKKDEANAKDETKSTGKKRVRNWAWLILTIVVFLFGAFGLVGLLALAFVPEETVWPPYHFQHAEWSAWEILNSNFTTAFAATWIALLVYAASQVHRLRVAHANVRIATNEAERVSKLREDRDLDRARDRHREAYQTVELQFLDSPPSGIPTDDLESSKRFESSFRRVEAAAKALALKDMELNGTESPNQIRDLTQGLNKFSPPPPLLRFFQPWTIATLVKALLDDNRIVDDNSQHWSSVYTALTAVPRDNNAVGESIGRLADTLQPSAVS